MISSQQVYISRGVVKAIEARSLENMTCEICGLLVGYRDDGYIQITDEISVINRAPNKETAFLIAPEDVIAAQREIRDRPSFIKSGKKLQIIGHYHSHPNGRMVPSQSDIEQIGDPSHLWLIAALNESSASIYLYHVVQNKEAPHKGYNLEGLTHCVKE